MTIRNQVTTLIIVVFCLFLTTNSQIPLTSYTLLTNYTNNPYFDFANQTLHRVYSSYLTDTTVTSVYLYTSNQFVSSIITYTNRLGTSYRATTSYIPSTRQFSVQSFGPIVSQPTTTTTPAINQAAIYGQQNGIGITPAQRPPSRADNLIPTSNPNIRNQQISVLLPNSTSTTRSSDSYSNSNSIYSSSSDSRNAISSSSSSSLLSSRSRNLRD